MVGAIAYVCCIEITLEWSGPGSSSITGAIVPFIRCPDCPGDSRDNYRPLLRGSLTLAAAGA